MDQLFPLCGSDTMKKLLVSAVLAVAAVLGLTLDSQAGLFRHHRGDCGGGCDTGCASSAPYGPVADCAPAPAPAPQYVEQKVTRYKQVMVEKEIEELVSRCVARQEKFTYNVQVPVMTPEKRTETFYSRVEKQVPFTYTVNVPVTVPEKRTETFYNRVEKQVPYTYTVNVPVTVPEKRTETFYNRVEKQVPYTYTVMVPETVQ